MSKGLALVIGVGKPKGKGGAILGGDEDKSSPAMGDDDEKGDDYYSIAFDALKDDDKEGFAKALKGAIKECMAGDDDAGESEESDEGEAA